MARAGPAAAGRMTALFEMVDRDDIRPVAREADERLRRALEQATSGR